LKYDWQYFLHRTDAQFAEQHFSPRERRYIP
jgi:hypothetical protein